MNWTPTFLKFAALASVLGLSLAPSLVSKAAIAADTFNLGTPGVQRFAQATGDIVDVASGNSAFSTLTKAVQAAGLVQTLKGDGPFTVFAPTNDAFNNLPPGVLDALLRPENKDLLTKVLLYHVVPGRVTSNALRTGSVETLNGGVAVNVSPERVVINNASVVQADVPASNGVVHAINRVLIPPGLVAELNLRNPVRGLY